MNSQDRSHFPPVGRAIQPQWRPQCAAQARLWPQTQRVRLAARACRAIVRPLRGVTSPETTMERPAAAFPPPQ